MHTKFVSVIHCYKIVSNRTCVYLNTEWPRFKDVLKAVWNLISILGFFFHWFLKNVQILFDTKDSQSPIPGQVEGFYASYLIHQGFSSFSSLSFRSILSYFFKVYLGTLCAYLPQCWMVHTVVWLSQWKTHSLHSLIEKIQFREKGEERFLPCAWDVREKLLNNDCFPFVMCFEGMLSSTMAKLSSKGTCMVIL